MFERDRTKSTWPATVAALIFSSSSGGASDYVARKGVATGPARRADNFIVLGDCACPSQTCAGPLYRQHTGNSKWRNLGV
jgi:hypothetical protein